MAGRNGGAPGGKLTKLVFAVRVLVTAPWTRKALCGSLLQGVLDRAFALTAIIGIFPLLVGLWLAVRLSSPGPVIFKQVRTGQDGREFTLLKFRSMYVDAESRKAELETRNEPAEGWLFEIRDDPRVTPVGRWLRRFSVDELPQLVNVVPGKMSLVGPRAPLPEEVPLDQDDVRRRLLVKPGLTGLWQISARSDLDWDESVRLDQRYVDNRSFTLDLLILWKTVLIAVQGKDANRRRPDGRRRARRSRQSS